MRTQTHKIKTKAKTEIIRSSRSSAPQYSHPIVQLQQKYGNQAVQRLLQSGHLQAKLTVGQPNNKCEQEADRVADQVMRMPEPKVQRQIGPEEEEEVPLQAMPLANTITPLIQRQPEPEEEEEEVQPGYDQEPEEPSSILESVPTGDADELAEENEEEFVQPKSNVGTVPQVTPGIAHAIHSIKGAGQPLPSSELAFFEPRFGRDFSHVRVHTDSRAARTAQSINARAFTLGRDVVFGGGQYSPGTSSSRRLLAHELMHVVQQARQSRVSYSSQHGVLPGIQRKVIVDGKNWTKRRGMNFVFYRFRSRNKRVRDKVWFRRFRPQFLSEHEFYYFGKTHLMSHLKYFARIGNEKYRQWVARNRIAPKIWPVKTRKKTASLEKKLKLILRLESDGMKILNDLVGEQKNAINDFTAKIGRRADQMTSFHGMAVNALAGIGSVATAAKYAIKSPLGLALGAAGLAIASLGIYAESEATKSSVRNSLSKTRRQLLAKADANGRQYRPSIRYHADLFGDKVAKGEEGLSASTHMYNRVIKVFRTRILQAPSTGRTYDLQWNYLCRRWNAHIKAYIKRHWIKTYLHRKIYMKLLMKSRKVRP